MTKVLSMEHLALYSYFWDGILVLLDIFNYTEELTE